MAHNNYNIRYFHSFDEELEEILNYIAYKLRNKKSAENLLEKISNCILNRSKSPEDYEKYLSQKNRKYIWYRIYVGNFTIFYTVRNKTMEIAHIIYHKRNLDKLI